MSQTYIPPDEVFREYDIRGIADSDLSDDFSERLGFSFASLLIELSRQDPALYGSKSKHLVLGQDCRLSSKRIADAVSSGVRRAGLDVISTGIVPTPLTYFGNQFFQGFGAMMITGSHNPSEYNGYKLTTASGSFYGSDLLNLKKRMSDTALKFSATTTLLGAYREQDLSQEYIRDLLSKLKLGPRKLKVVLDAGNGSGSVLGPKALSAFGVDVIPLFCEFDGRFPNHHPDPTVQKNLRSLSEAVVKQGADFGVGLDGDSDRIGIVDERGIPVYGDMLLTIFARDVLKHFPGATIMSEVKSSYRLYQEINRLGGNPLMWKTGHSLIKSKMKESGALLAGEMSGHIFFSDKFRGYDDAIYAALRLCEIMSHKPGETISHQLEHLAKTTATPELRVNCPDALKFKLIGHLAESLQALRLGPINTLDGARLDLADGWGLARASNTQPVLVLRFEAVTEAKLLELWKIFKQALVTSAKAVGHSELTLDDSFLEYS